MPVGFFIKSVTSGLSKKIDDIYCKRRLDIVASVVFLELFKKVLS